MISIGWEVSTEALRGGGDTDCINFTILACENYKQYSPLFLLQITLKLSNF